GRVGTCRPTTTISCSPSTSCCSSPISTKTHPSTSSISAIRVRARGWTSCPSSTAIPGDGFNPIWEEVQITFNEGFQPVQFTSDDQVLEAAAKGEITLTDTEEFYRCSVVGHK